MKIDIFGKEIWPGDWVINLGGHGGMTIGILIDDTQMLAYRGNKFTIPPRKDFCSLRGLWPASRMIRIHPQGIFSREHGDDYVRVIEESYNNLKIARIR